MGGGLDGRVGVDTNAGVAVRLGGKGHIRKRVMNIGGREDVDAGVGFTIYA